MSRDIETVLAELEGDRPLGPARIVVLDHPSTAQVKAIPLGSDAIVIDHAQMMSGMWREDTRDGLVEHIEVNSPDDVYHGILAYLPPPPSPDSALTADAIAEEIIEGLPMFAMFTEKTLHELLTRAVHMARDGMVYPPF
jgi:hypothetical protein